MIASPSQADFAAAARLTSSFYAWEERGRGWHVWPYAVEIEPPFRPFVHLAPQREPIIDDARKPSALSGWLDAFWGRTRSETAIESIGFEEPDPTPAKLFSVVTIQVALAPEVKISADTAEHFLLSLSTCTAPVSYEVVGTSDAITVQFACSEVDVSHVMEQLRAHFPDAVCSETEDALGAC